MDSKDEEKLQSPSVADMAAAEIDIQGGELLNSSGHVQELDRTFGVWSVIGVAIVADNAWAAGAGALVLALYNGGGPGVMYGLIASTIFYGFICAALAELASAIPSSANVYHWASVTGGPRFGRICSWYAGWWNAIAWIFGSCASCLVVANVIVAMYNLYHPDFAPQRWQMFIVYLVVVWGESALILFGQRFLARYASISGMLCMAMLVVITLVLAIMPSQTGYGYASNAFVWTEWQNLAGYSSDGFVFLAGMINGAYAIGTPDCVAHISEEVPNPRVNIPRGIAAQLSTGFVTTFVFYIAILYGVTSLDDVFNSPFVSLPLVAMFQQSVRSDAATFGVLFVFLLDMLVAIPGAWITASRMLWTLGRDNATPFSGYIGAVSPHYRNPFNAQVICACVGTVLGLIYIGSETAFNALIGGFTIFTTLSYLAAFMPHLLSGRRYVKPGPFWMPTKWAYPVLTIASAYVITFDVIYMFPYAMPFSIDVMNWNCVIFGGFTLLLTLWYLWKRSHGYLGPHVNQDAHDDIMTGFVGLDKEIEERRRTSVAVAETTARS